MKTVQVKLGKPSKFYVNNKRISLNTAFGMYKAGAKLDEFYPKQDLISLLYSIPDDTYREMSMITFDPNKEIPKHSVINNNDQRIEQYTNKKGELDRIGGPAKIIDDGKHITKFYYKKGKLHRGGGRPAVIKIDQDRKKRSEKWYTKGKLHRDGDKPARIEYAKDSQIILEQWYKEGKEHRNGDNPSFIKHFEDHSYNPGTIRLIPQFKTWKKNGKLHRGQGKPATEKWNYPSTGAPWPYGNVFDHLTHNKSYAFEGRDFPSRAAYTNYRNSLRNTALRTAGAEIRRRRPIREIMEFLDLNGKEEPLSPIR